MANPTHAYSTGGTYDVSLIVVDGASETSLPATTTANISPANVAPTANAGGPYSGTAGVSITVTGAASSDSDGTISTYRWNWGDGTSDTKLIPTASHHHRTARFSGLRHHLHLAGTEATGT